MDNVLDKIVKHKWGEIEAARATVPVAELQAQLVDAPPVRDFVQSLRDHAPVGLIAEVKKASPSAGLIREDFDPVQIAQIYQDNGAACISVLTDEHFFQGQLPFLDQIREIAEVPLLRKDFIVDPYQVYEARVHGADCILLIAECLDDDQVSELYNLAGELGMQCLIEVYETSNVERVLRLNPPLMGVNNRDLRTFQTDLNHTVRLRQLIPSEVLLVGESGIHTNKDVKLLESAGVGAILVGESLMRCEDIGTQVRELLS